MRYHYNRFNRIEWLGLLTLIPCMKFGSFTAIPALDKLFDYLKIADIFILACVYVWVIHAKRKTAFDPVVALTFVYLIYLTFSTLANGGSVWHLAVYCGGILLMFFWISIFTVMFPIKMDLIVLYYIAVTLLDILSRVAYPNGLYKPDSTVWMTNSAWILGYKNNYFPILALGFVIAYRNYTAEKRVFNKPQSIYPLFFSLSLVEIFYVSTSATSEVAALSLVAYFLFFRRLKNLKMWIQVLLAVNVAAFVFLILLSRDYAAFRIPMALFGKSYSVISRFRLWDTAKEAVLARPLFGYGLSAGNAAHPVANFDCHNRYLWSLVTIGLDGAYMLALMLFFIICKVIVGKNYAFSSFSLWMIFTIMVTWQTEVYGNVAFYIYGTLFFLYLECKKNTFKDDVNFLIRHFLGGNS